MNEELEKEIKEIFLDEIIPNRFQPRLNFDQKSLMELADSIKQHGIIQPLVVRKLGEKYEIIAGERRYKASQIIGLSKVPAIVVDLDDNKSAEVAIVENLHRKNMSALEEAKSYKKLLQRGITQEQLGISLGKSQSYIANKLRLLSLDEKVQEALVKEEISERHARSLLSIKDNNEQQKMLNEIINNKLTVKATDDIIKERYGVEEVVEEIMHNKESEIIEDVPVQPKKIEEEVIENQRPNNIMNFNLENIENEVEETKPIINAPKPFVYEEVEEEIQEKKAEPHNNYEENPQMDIINRLNNIENDTDLNIFKEATLVNPSPYVIPRKDIKDSYLTPQSNYAEPININNNENQSLNTSSGFDIDKLLESDKVQNNFQEEPISQNRFIINDEVKPKEDRGDISNSKNMIKKIIESIQNSGVKIDYEEFDFERLYQIIIKIDK